MKTAAGPLCENLNRWGFPRRQRSWIPPQKIKKIPERKRRVAAGMASHGQTTCEDIRKI
jgi:hypothetical protein